MTLFNNSAVRNDYRAGRVAVASKQRDQEGKDVGVPGQDCCCSCMEASGSLWTPSCRDLNFISQEKLHK